MADASGLILVWSASAKLHPHVVERETLPIQVLRCLPRRLDSVLAEASRAAAVVAVVDTPEQVDRALRCGADEALTLSDLNRDSFGACLARAVLRREGRERSVEAVRQSLCGPDAAMFDLFGEALASSVVNPLRSAASQLQTFRDALSAVSAVECRPPQSSRTPQTSRDSDPGSLVEDPLALIKNALESVERLEGVLLDAPVETVDAREVVDKVAALIRPVLERVADFSVDLAPQECWVRFPRRHMVQIVTSALHCAVLNVTRKGGDRFVEISLRPQEGATLVEICDDGDTLIGAMPRPWLPRAAAAKLHDPTAIGISLAATQLRQAGGELLVDVHPGEGTTLRMFLPQGKRPSLRVSAS